MSARQHGRPALVSPWPEVKVQRLVPLDYTTKAFPEGWLQELIRSAPDLLPINEVEEDFAPLVPIGLEVPLRRGSVDNLFVSPTGYVTIVETKLWRNPTARRTVVAQIIDYAKEISRWGYDELQDRCRSYLARYEQGRSRDSLYDWVRTSSGNEDLDEGKFVDAVARNLRAGRLLLLIVGDGIREDVEEMAAYLQGTPSLHFTLGLMELACYKWPDRLGETLLVLPRTVTRTQEVIRAVVQYRGLEANRDNLEIKVPEPDEDGGSDSSGGKRMDLTEEAFEESIERSCGRAAVEAFKTLSREWQGLGLKVVPASASMVFRSKNPLGSPPFFTMLRIGDDGAVLFYSLPNQLEKAGLPRRLAEAYFEEVRELFGGHGPVTDVHGTFTIGTVEQILPVRERFREILQRTIGRIAEAATEAEEN